MFAGLFERCLRIVAEAIPARIAYFVALRVFNHASFAAFSKMPMAQIKGLDALRFWHEDKVLPKPRIRTLTGRLKRRQGVSNLRPTGPPIWDQSAGAEGIIRPRQVGPAEMLSEGEVAIVGEPLETVKLRDPREDAKPKDPEPRA
jgi:hypothetical protein